MTGLNLDLLNLDSSRVDWVRLSNDAVFRRPPFEPGEKEKGFRDSLIMESFVQLVEQSPSTPSLCRVVLVTEDDLLSRAVRARTEHRTNVAILASIEELKSLINTLVSKVSEEFVTALKTTAATYFFDRSNKEGLYYKFDVRKIIKNKFGKQLTELPAGATERVNEKWLISTPKFLKKEARRISWASRVTINVQTYRHEEPKLEQADLPQLWASKPEGQGSVATRSSEMLFGALSAALLGSGKLLYKTGRSVFEVFWTATVNARRKLMNPHLDDVTFVSTTWD